ncbi:tetratricopeptide repeat protein [Gulosibacter faecalis]|uniref:Tetratricopeptide repeat protein n=1 Tax=Gulosibacter faecalis TaxID=272240 RepID=A0ABW5UY13_9MICO|nr:tetratricopeptide repeat protein [Gulosibacter faecalis]
MRSANGAKIGVYVLVALMAIYVVAIAGLVWGLVTSGDVAGIIMGIALTVFPIVGVLFVVRDLQFVAQSNRLVERMAEAGELPEDNLPRQNSGRPERAAADADFEVWKAQTEAAPEQWRNWVLLGLAYRASGDTARARKALRQAISLERES